MRGKVRREGGREEERKGEEGEVREGGREKGKVRKER